MSSGYEELMGTPMDPENHPASNTPTATEHYAGDISPDWRDLRQGQDSKLTDKVPRSSGESKDAAKEDNSSPLASKYLDLGDAMYGRPRR